MPNIIQIELDLTKLLQKKIIKWCMFFLTHSVHAVCFVYLLGNFQCIFLCLDVQSDDDDLSTLLSKV